MSPAIGHSTLPTRSQIENWDSAHLDQAAARWRALADESEVLFDKHRQNIAAPGGTAWVGQAKDAAWDRVTADSGVVSRQSESQRRAADVAADGAGDLRAAQRKTLDAIAEAEADGFKVGEDLSLTDTRRVDISAAAARQTAANEHAEYIRWNAQQLAATDGLIGDQLTAEAAELEGIRFDESPRDGSIQAVDFNAMPESPRLPLPEKAWEYNLDLTSEIEAYGPSVPGGGTSAGAVTSINDVWNELQSCFNCNFPMGGAPKEFPKVGDKLPLEIRTMGQKLASFPVEVTQIEKTASDINIEFLTLPGHVDGAGSTIHFRFYEQGGQVHLGIRGYIADGPGSQEGPFGAPLRVGYTEIAKATWQPYIDNVTRHVAQPKGMIAYDSP